MMIDPSPHVLWGREHVDYDPLRLVLPEHEDYSAFSWIEAAPSPDTGAVVHYYKRRFRGYLRFDHEGRVYRHSDQGPRLLSGDRRITTLRAFVELFEDEPDILPGLIRIRYDDEEPAELLARTELRTTDGSCEGCRRDAAAAGTDEPGLAR